MPTRMRANIDMTNGLVMSEAVMMGLGPYIGREYAHDLVYDLCREALAREPSADRDAGGAPGDQQACRPRRSWTRMCDPANYLGQAGVMVDRVLASRR